MLQNDKNCKEWQVFKNCMDTNRCEKLAQRETTRIEMISV